MKINNVCIIEEESCIRFENNINRACRNKNVLDIKFAVTPETHSSGFGSYSAGEKYYAMIIYGQ